MAGKMSRVDEIYREEGYVSYLKRIEAMKTGATSVHIALYQATKEFIKLARDERAAKRAEILRGHTRPGELKFSDKIIYMGDRETGPVLRWVQVWRPKATLIQEGNNDVRYNNVPSTNGVVSRTVLKKGAHPDEVELLYQHNEQVKAFKEAWARLAETRRSIKKMRDHGVPGGGEDGD